MRAGADAGLDQAGQRPNLLGRRADLVDAVADGLLPRERFQRVRELLARAAAESDSRPGAGAKDGDGDGRDGTLKLIRNDDGVVGDQCWAA